MTNWLYTTCTEQWTDTGRDQLVNFWSSAETKIWFKRVTRTQTRLTMNAQVALRLLAIPMPMSHHPSEPFVCQRVLEFICPSRPQIDWRDFKFSSKLNSQLNHLSSSSKRTRVFSWSDSRNCETTACRRLPKISTNDCFRRFIWSCCDPPRLSLVRLGYKNDVETWN